MSTGKWVVSLLLAFALGGFGGWSVAQSPGQVREVECLVDIPPCVCECVFTPRSTPPGPAVLEPPAECPPCPDCEDPPVRIRVQPAFRHLLHGAVGDDAQLAGYTWNRSGRVRPAVFVVRDSRGDWTGEYNYWRYGIQRRGLSVARERTIGLVGVTIGLGRR